MDLYTYIKIRQDPNLYNYLRENSHWYKYLNRDSKNLKFVVDEMKEKYKLTAKDKIERLSRNIDMITSFIDVLK